MSKIMQLYNELRDIVDLLRPYYDIDKIKFYSVYVWSKSGTNDHLDSDNLFDIQAKDIIFYDKQHKIIEETLPIITMIQEKLREIETCSLL